jgi:hypothetical protein
MKQNQVDIITHFTMPLAISRNILDDLDLTELERLRASFDSIANTPPVKLQELKPYMEKMKSNQKSNIWIYALTAAAGATALGVILIIIRMACQRRAGDNPSTTPTNIDKMQFHVHPTAPPRSIAMDIFSK